MFEGVLFLIFMAIGAFTKGIEGCLYFIVAALFYIALTIDTKGGSK